MKRALRVVSAACLTLYLISPAIASEEITAEKLGGFYPAQWEAEGAGRTAFSNLAMPGHQKASTSRYYAFGQVEIIYYDRQDSIYEKRTAKLKGRDKKFEVVEISGCPAVVFNKQRVIADVGGQILAYLECYTCESQGDLMSRFQMIDLAGLKSLLE
jgi:hypothetical protein